MTARRHRVLVVDDSAFARKVMREVLSADPSLEVVGIARDGLEALEKIAEVRPDVVTLDVMMPGLDGPGVIRALRALRPLRPKEAPPIVVVSTAKAESELVVDALALGAFDFVHKPTNLATDRLYELGGELVGKVRAAAEAHVDAIARAGSSGGAEPIVGRAPSRGEVRLVAIGTSTGGPAALNAILPALPLALPAPVVVALHIPAEYTGAMAERLDAESRLRVVEASDGLALVPGTVVLARGGTDLTVDVAGSGLVVRTGLDRGRTHHPSVDALFESAARACGRGVLGVVLTGMGEDGLAGARAIRGAGGSVVVESEASAVVWGMPRAVWAAGLADARLLLGEIAAEIARRVGVPAPGEST